MWIERRAEAEAGRSFATHAIAAALADGETGRAAARGVEVLREADRAGVLPSGADDLALWGSGIDTEGSLAILVELGRVCAGWGMAVHCHALARRLASELHSGPAAIVAAPIAPRCPPPEVLARPDPLWIDPRIEDGHVVGVFPHVWGFPHPDAPTQDALAFVRQDDTWAVVRTNARVTRDDRRRLGLRACDLFRVELEGDPGEPVAGGDRARLALAEHVARLWLGMAAVAAGCASGAVREAARYAAERYQGGVAIERHAAVRMLLGEARARADSAVAALGAAEPKLAAAARVRLTAASDAAAAVTGALQVLGGSGYMEDFPLAKRLRDVEVLRISQGTPDDLRRILAADLARCA